MIIRALRADDIDAVVEFSARAWRPVFESFMEVMGPGIFRRIYPHWRGHHEGFAMRHLTHGVGGPVISLAWAPDSRHLATLESEHKSVRLTVHVRSQADRSRAVSLPPGLTASQVTWSPDGTLLALSGPHCPHTVLMDPADGSQRRVLDGVSGPVAWEPEGQLVLWDIETGKSQFVQLFHETLGTSNRRHPIAGLALAPDHRRLALAFDTATPGIWQITGDLPNYQE